MGDRKVYRVAVDVGGTFTDVIGLSLDGEETKMAKVPSTPQDSSEGVINGILKLDIPLDQITLITHGTTVGTNALITRTYPRAAMVTTKGFRDILEMRDSTKIELWDAYWDMPKSYIQRRDRFELSGRIAASGEVIEPLNDEELGRVIDICEKRQYLSIGICLYNSYINSEHEAYVAQRLRERLRSVYVSVSSELVPELGEFPRVSTTAVNTILAPVLGSYLAKLKERLVELNCSAQLLIVHSGGGVMPVESAIRYAARFAASGLAGGAAAMRRIAGDLGIKDAIGIDIGGTSTDVSLIHDGELLKTQEWRIEPGYPIRFPSIEVASVGAGGGSIVWIDQGGSVRNGPQSAGAVPGPASYGRGGALPTNTDAHLVVGHLGRELAGNAVVLNKEDAAAALERDIGAPNGWTAEEAATAALRIADSNIVNAVRLISLQKGYDPRDFTLVAFGGGGPLHAVTVARTLSIPRVVVPPHPGITSALGCALLNMVHDDAASFLELLAGDVVVRLRSRLGRSRDAVLQQLRRDGADEGQCTTRSYATLHYEGQWRSLEIAIEDDDTLESIEERFLDNYRDVYSYEEKHGAITFVGYRVEGVGRLIQPSRPRPMTAVNKNPPEHGRRRIHWGKDWGNVQTPIYRRTELLNGHRITGPAIIEEMDSTTVIPPKVSAMVDEFGNIDILLQE